MAILELEQKRRRVTPQPLIYRWSGRDEPLPVRVIQARRSEHSPPHGLASPPWHATGDHHQPFDFTDHIRRLCADITQRCDEMRHIDVSRLLFCVTQARNARRFGLQARVTPLRFPHGHLTRQRRGVTYQVQRYFHGTVEYLYLVTFCLPRFLEQEFDDKFVTLFHELYHISPDFDGDLRRHEGRYCVHSHSQKHYDRRMAMMAREYLAGRPDPALHAFLRLNFSQLVRRHDSVVGVMVPRPKMVPVILSAASREK